MITLNLLPDIKKEHVKAQRFKRLIMLTSLAVSAVCILLVVLLFMLVNVAQRYHINRLTDDIEEHTQSLQEIKDLDKILTIQNQLNMLPQLHDQKPIVSRLFQYLTVITPVEISLGQLRVGLTEGGNNIAFTGTGTDYRAVNKFVDTLKNAEFTYKEVVDGQAVAQPAKKVFSSVVVESVGTNPNRPDGGVGFSIKAVFDLLILDNTKEEVTVTVPNITSTQSILERPSPIFDGSGVSEEEEANP